MVHDDLEVGAPRSVAVDAIEQELRLLWTIAGVEQEPGATRTCALNLIVVSEVGWADHDFQTLVGRITAEHPCRVFQVQVQPARQPSALEAMISAYCHRPAATEAQICCEQITLTAAGEAVDDLRGTLAPLLLGDLPVFLWWCGRPPFQVRRFRRLAGISDRVVIDTAQDQESMNTLGALAGWARDKDSDAVPGDLNWRRLFVWRDLIAGVFDPPGGRELLRDIQRIEVRSDPATGGGPSVRFFYLAGWLATRLGWTLRESTAKRTQRGFSIELDAGTHVVPLIMAADHKGGGVHGLLIEAGQGTKKLTALLQAGAETGPLTCRVEHQGREPRTLTREAGDPDLASLVMRELEASRRDPIYQASLEMAGKLAACWSELS